MHDDVLKNMFSHSFELGRHTVSPLGCRAKRGEFLIVILLRVSLALAGLDKIFSFKL